MILAFFLVSSNFLMGLISTQHYCTEVGRTFFSAPSEQQKKDYAFAKDLQAHIISQLKPKVLLFPFLVHFRFAFHFMAPLRELFFELELIFTFSPSFPFDPCLSISI